jgi:hypothetical protein
MFQLMQIFRALGGGLLRQNAGRLKYHTDNQPRRGILRICQTFLHGKHKGLQKREGRLVPGEKAGKIQAFLRGNAFGNGVEQIFLAFEMGINRLLFYAAFFGDK